MVATQAALQHTPEAVVREMSASMETHAAAGDWERVEEIAARIKTAIVQVPEHERHDVILSVQRSMERVQSLAQESREEVATKLSAIRRGKDAAKAYAGAD